MTADDSLAIVLLLAAGTKRAFRVFPGSRMKV
jgi:hypothetical protein